MELVLVTNEEYQVETRDVFPLNSAMWPGCVLASVAHAVFLCRAPLMDYERVWQGSIYSVTDSQGANGVIAFGEDSSQFVAAFFLDESDRSPFRRNGPGADEGLMLLRRIPLPLQPLVDMALPFLTSDFKGVPMPLVSSAFWSGLRDGHSTSCEPWGDVRDNGASLIDRELLSEQAALAAYAEDMDLGDAEIALVASLHRRRLANASGEMVLTRADADQLRRFAHSGDGIQACAKAFGRIGISFPVD